jgi:hypothetical protein
VSDNPGGSSNVWGQIERGFARAPAAVEGFLFGGTDNGSSTSNDGSSRSRSRPRESPRRPTGSSSLVPDGLPNGLSQAWRDLGALGAFTGGPFGCG